MSNEEVKGYKEFEFDLPSALLRRLIEKLDKMDAGTSNDVA